MLGPQAVIPMMAAKNKAVKKLRRSIFEKIVIYLWANVMATKSNIRLFEELKQNLDGELHFDETSRMLYATDASAYREFPTGVCIPTHKEDLLKVVRFASENRIPLIPRAAGTSLAGQVVGKGLVVDVGRHMNRILEINTEEGWVRVEPGVIRDELNMALKEHGYMFGPETSTANRAMMGGMIGNNSCGANSVVYGSTRDKLLEVEAILSDGNESTFGELDQDEFLAKKEGKKVSGPLERQIYETIWTLLSNGENRNEIRKEFPKPCIPRRNTGYAIDLLLDSEVFGGKAKFNFSKIIAGSEGTLAMITSAKLKIDPLPPTVAGLLAIHFDSIHDSLLGNLEALKFDPFACELMDHYILECTKGNKQQSANRFFIEGDPKALLVVELRRKDEEELKRDCEHLVQILKEKNLGYHFPLITGPDMARVWTLRKAGLGLLSNIPGDAKPVPVIEDTAVDVADLPEYIREFNEILEKKGLFCVHYAHAGSGELHLRPILNLKTEEGAAMFREIAGDIAGLVKKYKGSLSGEHGDGRLRGEFIPRMIGEKNYSLLREVKNAWDPDHIFNPGKIIDTPPMDKKLRYYPGQKTRELNTNFKFEREKGFQRAVEQCNGSGDCRKTELTGGTMCPSYMATRDEKDTTRARANILRETLSFSEPGQVFNSRQSVDILDLCLSCKGCTSECPSNVDMARMKAEYMTQYYDLNGAPFRTRMIAKFTKAYKFGSSIPFLFNFFLRVFPFSTLTKQILGVAGKRKLPTVASKTLYRWYRENRRRNFGYDPITRPIKTVYLFCDEFTNYNDAGIGKTAVKLLTALNYDVRIVPHKESGRTQISKGFLRKVKRLATKNVKVFYDIVGEDSPLVGLEPSAILSFRDEYPDLVEEKWRDKARELSAHCLTFEEFIEREIDEGHISSEKFTREKRRIRLHGHCHQKALSSMVPSKKMLKLPANYEVQLIPSGCCGMAGSFGYEKEHYDISMKIGELVLFPEIRKEKEDTIIAAAGTSCRHQITDGTGRKAKHPAEILFEALETS